MEISNVLGFLVVVFFLALPTIKKMMVESKSKQNQPLEFDFIEEEEEEPVKVVVPPKIYKKKEHSHRRKIKKDYSLKTNIENRYVKSHVENRSFHSEIEDFQRNVDIGYEWDEEKAKLQKQKRKKKSFFSEPGSFKKMIIMHEIMMRKG